MALKHWLMKAEPDSRVVKGKDVKFSVDDFEAAKTTPWEGVRNAEARNLMKEMNVGDKVLFYHSNCKSPGIAGFAEVSKEAYPDYTAWDATHPYYDAKTDKENPKWFMVDVTFKSRATHFVPLALLRRIAAAPASSPPDDVAYIEAAGAKAIQQMALVTRGRLSVQRVEKATWDVVVDLAAKGGWEEEAGGSGKPKARGRGKAKEAVKESPAKTKAEPGNTTLDDEAEAAEVEQALKEEPLSDVKPAGRKRKAKEVEEEETEAIPVRRSTRARK